MVIIESLCYIQRFISSHALEIIHTDTAMNQRCCTCNGVERDKYDSTGKKSDGTQKNPM